MLGGESVCRLLEVNGPDYPKVPEFTEEDPPEPVLRHLEGVGVGPGRVEPSLDARSVCVPSPLQSLPPKFSL